MWRPGVALAAGLQVLVSDDVVSEGLLGTTGPIGHEPLEDRWGIDSKQDRHGDDDGTGRASKSGVVGSKPVTHAIAAEGKHGQRNGRTNGKRDGQSDDRGVNLTGGRGNSNGGQDRPGARNVHRAQGQPHHETAPALRLGQERVEAGQPVEWRLHPLAQHRNEHAQAHEDEQPNAHPAHRVLGQPQQIEHDRTTEGDRSKTDNHAGHHIVGAPLIPGTYGQNQWQHRDNAGRKTR